MNQEYNHEMQASHATQCNDAQVAVPAAHPHCHASITVFVQKSTIVRANIENGLTVGRTLPCIRSSYYCKPNLPQL